MFILLLYFLYGRSWMNKLHPSISTVAFALSPATKTPKSSHAPPRCILRGISLALSLWLIPSSPPPQNKIDAFFSPSPNEERRGIYATTTSSSLLFVFVLTVTSSLLLRWGGGFLRNNRNESLCVHFGRRDKGISPKKKERRRTCAKEITTCPAATKILLCSVPFFHRNKSSFRTFAPPPTSPIGHCIFWWVGGDDRIQFMLYSSHNLKEKNNLKL